MAADAALLAWFTKPPAEEPGMQWSDCPMCWRAGRILTTDGIYYPCATCLGVGQVAA